jgi:tetratricopeptide (TPR) repeat protein
MCARRLRYSRLWGRERCVLIVLSIALLALALPLAAQDPPAPAEPAETTYSTRITPEEIQSSYRQILGRWSAGEDERAPRELIAMETAALDEGQPKSRKALVKAEQGVIHEIGAVDLEALVPIAVLHHEAYRRLLEGGDTGGKALLLGHSRTMARDLVLLYWQQSGLEGAQLVASRLLTSLAGMLLKASQQLQAAEMFNQAVELDPRNTTALMGLALIWEKNSQYDDAIQRLKQLLEVEPANDEARLRLALCLKRRDKPDLPEARKVLEELVGNGTTPWVLPLAFEELARTYVDLEKPGEAEKALRKGLERFKGEPRLRLQLAVVLDRRGATKEAGDLAEKIVAEPLSDEATPRFLYNTVRQEGFAGTREFLSENSRSRLSVLTQALGGGNPKVGEVAR